MNRREPEKEKKRKKEKKESFNLIFTNISDHLHRLCNIEPTHHNANHFATRQREFARRFGSYVGNAVAKARRHRRAIHIVVVAVDTVVVVVIVVIVKLRVDVQATRRSSQRDVVSFHR